MMNADDEGFSSLKEDIGKLKEEYVALYDRLPAGPRVQLQAQTQEFHRRLNRLAQSKEYYYGDKSSYEALRKNGKRLLIGAFGILVAFGLAREWSIFEASLRIELILYGSIAVTGLAHWVEYLLAQKTLAFSARQFSSDESDLRAFGVSLWDRNEVNAALLHLNEYLDLGDVDYTHDQKQLHYKHMKLNWQVSAMQDYLIALGIDWQ